MPTRQAVPLPSPPFPPGSSPLLVPGFLTPAERGRLIARAEEIGFRSPAPEYPPSYRNNDRLVLDDPALAGRLMERLAPHLPARLRVEGRDWRPSGLNERFRLCRYRPGQRFGIHRDGVHRREDGQRSLLTFMVYLNGAGEFRGGSTRFFPTRGAPASSTVALAPTAGTLILFTHDLWHDGEEVSGGVKYVLRSDVVYRCDAPGARPAPQGYLWNVVETGPGELATGSRDPSIWLWSMGAGGATPHARLAGHTHSVTALLCPGPGQLWSGSRDRTIRLWRLRDGGGECRRVLAGHAGVVLSLARLGSGLVASGSADGTIRSWTAEGEPLAAVDAGGGWIWALAGLGGSRLACGAEDGTLQVWDLERGQRVGEVGRTGVPVRSLLALPDGRIASGHTDGRIRLWSPEGASRWRGCGEHSGHEADVRALAALPLGGLASGSEDGTVRVWRPPYARGEVVGHHADFVTGLCVSSDGRLASVSYDGTVQLWDLARAARPRAAS